jgi:hypothetical protein
VYSNAKGLLLGLRFSHWISANSRASSDRVALVHFLRKSSHAEMLRRGLVVRAGQALRLNGYFFSIFFSIFAGAGNSRSMSVSLMVSRPAPRSMMRALPLGVTQTR